MQGASEVIGINLLERDIQGFEALEGALQRACGNIAAVGTFQER